jgi:hypothetical protein
MSRQQCQKISPKFQSAVEQCTVGSTLDSVFRIATAVQQIMTEFNCAVSEEEKIVTINKIVIKLMNINGH